MKLKDFIRITKKSTFVSIRIENVKPPIYCGKVVRIPDTIREYDIISIDTAVFATMPDLSAYTAVLVIDVKEEQT